MKLKPIKKPELINLSITEVCDSKCVMCNVWKDDKKDAFLPDVLKKKFNNSFYSEVRHLGISGGEPTLNPLLIENIEVIVSELKLKSLSITSHGFHTDRHKELLPKIIQICERNNVKFGLNISLDGIDETHIKIRRIKDAFKKTTDTAFYAKSIGIPVQLQTTVSRDNVYNIVKVREFAIKNGFESIFRVATEISRLYNEDLQEGIALNKSQKSFLSDFLKSERTIIASYSVGRRLFYSDLAKRLTTGVNRKAPCSFQSTGLFLSPVGNIFNCSISNKPLEIDAGNLEKSIKSVENSQILSDLIKNKCQKCLHDQSGRWSLYHYLKVHNKTRKYYLNGMKLYRVFNLIKEIIISNTKKRNLLTNKTNRILIIGMYGGEHVGDAAILGGVILRLKERFNFTDIDVLSIRKDRTECWVDNLDLPFNINVMDIKTKVDPYNYDMLVLAGGPIMNIPTILLNHIKEIKKFKKIKKPFLIEGVGYGPLKTQLSKYLARKIISTCDEISLRTKEDFKKVVKFRKDSIETYDPAFDYLKYYLKKLKGSNDKFLNNVLKEEKKICIINLRPSDKSYNNRNGVEESEEKMLKSLVYFMKNNSVNMRYIFMPMNSDQFGFCDFEIAYKLEDKIKESRFNLDFSIWETEVNINDCLLLLNKASLTISMRFHGCIFSLSTDTPTIGIDYSTIEKGKVYNLFKHIQKDHQVVNINDILEDSIIKIASQLI